jgi:hypothetical protein
MTMKWLDLAKLLLPIVGGLVPGAAPLVPTILIGITDAEHLGEDGAAKKAHVLQLVADGAATANATGKVTIDPTQAVFAAESVFNVVDSVRSTLKANAAVDPIAPPAAAPPAGGVTL